MAVGGGVEGKRSLREGQHEEPGCPRTPLRAFKLLYYMLPGAHEPPKAAKERVTHEYSRVPCKYKSWERASSNNLKKLPYLESGSSLIAYVTT